MNTFRTYQAVPLESMKHTCTYCTDTNTHTNKHTDAHTCLHTRANTHTHSRGLKINTHTLTHTDVHTRTHAQTHRVKMIWQFKTNTIPELGALVPTRHASHAQRDAAVSSCGKSNIQNGCRFWHTGLQHVLGVKLQFRRLYCMLSCCISAWSMRLLLVNFR